MPHPEEHLQHFTPQQLWIIHQITKGEFMSAFTDAFAAALTNLQGQIKAGGGLTQDQAVAAAHSVVDPAIADLSAKVSAIASSEADDATKLADLQTAMDGFVTAFGPASAPSNPPADTTGSTDASAAS